MILTCALAWDWFSCLYSNNLCRLRTDEDKPLEGKLLCLLGSTIEFTFSLLPYLLSDI